MEGVAPGDYETADVSGANIAEGEEVGEERGEGGAVCGENEKLLVGRVERSEERGLEEGGNEARHLPCMAGAV